MENGKKFPDIIELNVGGSLYTTTLLTLTKCKDSMLSAMFSGNYTAVCDKDGRFFIDADGANFIYILNYLRYCDLPPPKIAEVVYREALYFGIHELVQELEKYPAILGKIQRNRFRASFPGYQDCLDSIMTLISQTCPKSTTTEIIVLLFHEKKNQTNGPRPEDYNYNHICFYNSGASGKTHTADAKLGPWKADMSEREVMKCLLFDLESQGFVVTYCFVEECDYNADTEHSCQKQFFKLTFHWWKKAD